MADVVFNGINAAPWWSGRRPTGGPEGSRKVCEGLQGFCEVCRGSPEVSEGLLRSLEVALALRAEVR
eukprot:13755704-Alexandrium_andersonii.AAC.1